MSIEDVIKELVKKNKKHYLNYYIITDKKEYIKKLLNNEIDCFQKYIYEEKLLENKNFIKKATKSIKSIFRYVDSEFYYDRKLVINVLNKGFSHKETLIKLLEIYNDDIDMIKHILKNNGTLYYFLDDKYKIDLDLIKLSIRHSFNDNVYIHLKDEYKNDFSLSLLAVKYSKAHYAFNYIPEEFKTNEIIIKETLKNNGWGIQYFDDNIRNNKEYALMSISNNGYALKFLSDELKNDFNIVLMAFMNNPKSIEFASNQMKEVFKVV